MVKNKKVQITVVVGVVRKDNNILLVRRSEPEIPNIHLKWELPGGKVEFYETAEEALVREIREETGVIVEIEGLLPFSYTKDWEYPWGLQHTIIFAYKCKLVHEDNRLPDHRVKEARWVDLDDVSKLERLIGVDYFIEQLGR